VTVGPSQSKVTVRVEVVVEGGQATPLVKTFLKERNVQYPQPSPADTPVRQSGGVNYINAGGGSTVVLGHYPSVVYAMAYPNTTTDPNDPANATPPAGAVSDNTLADGTWSFTQAKGNQVPGAKCDGTSGAPNNSTLLVWYDYGGSPHQYTVEAMYFHGYCPAGSGSGPGLGAEARTVRVGCELLSTTLHATFTGALSALRTVKLAWNGASWVGETAGGGGSVLSFLWHDPVFQLLSAGPGTAFVVAGRPGSFHPFHWSAAGTALGASAGPFGVTITE
jgi:hypothetical protein